ncbi:hypothetical protein RJ640_006054 [Escallonia rubra]|uniref:DRBM domain-containing protein n=1 Tax=Escallonia rubra TaxID=112253 RepID=A0AA88RK68_9ASTE|nr:hypothetical protein RJ640_006054 [Escallonia rubra]
MYKNQLQELAQRSCFNLPSYTCIREGPDHAPRFKAVASFNGESFESPHHCSTLRQAEHAAAEVALASLSSRGPSPSLAARILMWSYLDEFSGHDIYKFSLVLLVKNSGFHIISSGIMYNRLRYNKFTSPSNINLNPVLLLDRQVAREDASSSSEPENSDEQEQIRIARALMNYLLKEKMRIANSTDGSMPFQKKFLNLKPRPSSPQPPMATTSKILPLICQKTASHQRHVSKISNEGLVPVSQFLPPSHRQVPESRTISPLCFPAAGAAPYVPFRHLKTPYQGIAPPITIRTAIPVYSAPTLPAPPVRTHQVIQPRPVRISPPVCIRQAVPAFAALPARKLDPPPVIAHSLPSKLSTPVEETGSRTGNDLRESEVVKILEQLKF